MPAARRALRPVIVTALSVLCALSGCAGASVTATPVALTQTSPSVTATVTPTAEASPSGLATPAPTGTPKASPSPTTVKTTKPTPVASPACPQTSKQKDVETALAAIGTYGAIVVDGRQSAADCATIKRFQRRMGIIPADGSAGATTVDVARRIAATDVNACGAGTATMACVDLTHQTFYVMQGGKVVVGPTVTRTGKPGFATPAATFTIFERAKIRWSTPFHVWLPYWQQFFDGDGLHETTTYIHNMAIGSHGCVNLLHADAVAAYSLLKLGSKIRLYGRRPGT